MRCRKVVPVLAALPVLLGGCSSVGTTSGTASPASSGATPWLLVAPGSSTPSPAPTILPTRSPSVPWWPSKAASPCPMVWPTGPQVFIPMLVTPGRGSLTVQWPPWYGPDYRVTAVDQRLVSGAQPEPRWLSVKAGNACTVTATLTGLKSGNPYVVWLDAPNTPHDIDGSRSLYSGRSAVVKPL